MSYKALQGKKVAVLTETEFITHELDYYKIGFKVLGASVDFLTNMWGEWDRSGGEWDAQCDSQILRC